MHKCDAVVVASSDYCLHRRADGRNYIGDFIKKLGVDCDRIFVSGSVYELVRPTRPEYREKLLDCLRYSVFHHEAKTIHLISNEGCSAYARFLTNQKINELEMLKSDLLEARKILLKQFPNVEICLYIAKLEKGEKDVFKIQRVES